MKFFEIYDPYYSLIKADDKKSAIKKYVEAVAADDGTLQEGIKQVSRDYALVNFSRTRSENDSLIPSDEIIRIFNEPESDILTIDGALL